MYGKTKKRQSFDCLFFVLVSSRNLDGDYFFIVKVITSDLTVLPYLSVTTQ